MLVSTTARRAHKDRSFVHLAMYYNIPQYLQSKYKPQQSKSLISSNLHHEPYFTPPNRRRRRHQLRLQTSQSAYHHLQATQAQAEHRPHRPLHTSITLCNRGAQLHTRRNCPSTSTPAQRDRSPEPHVDMRCMLHSKRRVHYLRQPPLGLPHLHWLQQSRLALHPRRRPGLVSRARCPDLYGSRWSSQLQLLRHSLSQSLVSRWSSVRACLRRLRSLMACKGGKDRGLGQWNEADHLGPGGEV